MTRPEALALPLTYAPHLDPQNRTCFIKDATGKYIADVDHEQDAAALVHAANHADALAKALEGALPILDIEIRYPEDRVAAEAAMREARAALDAYRGGK